MGTATMINFIGSLPAGDSVSLYTTPNLGNITKLRVLRRTDGAFSGPDDPDALVVDDFVLDGREQYVFTDFTALNGNLYYYRVYHWDADTVDWDIAYDERSITPQAQYRESGQDPYLFIANRLELGLAIEIDRDNLKFYKLDGSAELTPQVYLAPPLIENVKYPVVALVLTNLSTNQNMIGDGLGVDEPFGTDEWDEDSGSLITIRVSIQTWSHNANERHQFLTAIERILLANYSTFSMFGMTELNFTSSHVDDMSFTPPAYQTITEFSAMISAKVLVRLPTIADVQLTHVEDS